MITLSKTHISRLISIATVFVVVSLIIFLVLSALNENINLFFTPSMLKEARVSSTQVIRIGGLVKTGSIQRKEGLITSFILTDNKDNIFVEYNGILPDLFREEQGIVALGQINKKGVFIATQVLAKHAETYMPKELHNALHQGTTIDDT